MAYVFDLPLYAAVAVIGLAILYIVGVVLPAASDANRDWKLTLMSTVVDAIINGIVYVGVTARDSGVKRTWGSTIDRAFEVLWAVLLIDLAITLIVRATSALVFGSLEETGFGFFAAPTILFWTALSFSEAAAAIDDTAPGGRLLTSIRNGIGRALRIENFGRLLLVAGVTQIPAMLASIVLVSIFALLHNTAASQHFTATELFWLKVPFDVLTTGFFAAIVGIAYRDLRSRPKAD